MRRVADLLRDMGKLDLSNVSILDAGCGIVMLSEMFYVLGGYLILLDQHKDEPYSPASHVRFRTKAMYRDAMSRMNAHECGRDDRGLFLVYRIHESPRGDFEASVVKGRRNH